MWGKWAAISCQRQVQSFLSVSNTIYQQNIALWRSNSLFLKFNNGDSIFLYFYWCDEADERLKLLRLLRVNDSGILLIVICSLINNYCDITHLWILRILKNVWLKYLVCCGYWESLWLLESLSMIIWLVCLWILRILMAIDKIGRLYIDN